MSSELGVFVDVQRLDGQSVVGCLDFARNRQATIAAIVERISDWRPVTSECTTGPIIDRLMAYFELIRQPDRIDDEIGDFIRRNQLTRLRQLGSASIRAEIGRVDFRFDPEQVYVVVDIETTGGWASGDRITEIGAVKIRNHQVVGEWHSLLNPQRSIPAKIVQLTGITNDMVRGAPLFAEVAESFMEFMDDGIFVAHNVNFDYGFIAREYERLDRRFRFPKLCTCAGMRRRFPGHRSYSLGNLCETYGIDLDDHHRALCDANAAAHLLNLMNRRREEEAPTVLEDAA